MYKFFYPACRAVVLEGGVILHACWLVKRVYPCNIFVYIPLIDIGIAMPTKSEIIFTFFLISEHAFTILRVNIQSPFLERDISHADTIR